jgi:hypothetical protein
MISDFSVLHSVQTGAAVHSASYATDTMSFLPGIEGLGFESDHLSPSSAKAKNSRSYIYTLPYFIMVWCLIKYKDNFYPSSPRSILILSTHLHLGLPSDLFPSDFLISNLCVFLFSPIRATCPAHLILLYVIILITFGEAPDYAVLFSLLSLHLSSVQIFSATVFSNTFLS